MVRKLQIKIEDEVFHQLKELCKGDESVMQDYITNILQEKFNQSNGKISSREKDSLESYLKKGQPGNRHYGVKGQGWWGQIKLFTQAPDFVYLKIKYLRTRYGW